MTELKGQCLSGGGGVACAPPGVKAEAREEPSCGVQSREEERRRSGQ